MLNVKRHVRVSDTLQRSANHLVYTRRGEAARAGKTRQCPSFNFSVLATTWGPSQTRGMKKKPKPKTQRAKKSVPREDTKQIAYRVMQEVIKGSESI